MISLLIKTNDFTKDYYLLIETYDFTKMINLLIKTYGYTKNDKFVNKKGKGVILENKKVFPLVCSKYSSSWTGLGKSGHDQITTLGSISHVSDAKLSFR